MMAAPNCASKRITPISNSVTASRSPGPASRMTRPALSSSPSAAAGPVGPPGSAGRTAITVSACIPRRSSAFTPLTSRAGQVTIAALSAAPASGRPARWSCHCANSSSRAADVSGSRSRRVSENWLAVPQVWFSVSAGTNWWRQTPRPAGRPFAPLATSGAAQPSGRSARPGSSRSNSCQRRPTARLMSSIASRTTQGIVPPSPFRSIPRSATHYTRRIIKIMRRRHGVSDGAVAAWRLGEQQRPY